MKMHFDVLFLDTTANKYYDRTTLEKDALGGTEASVIRVAEGLAALELRVAVVQSRVPFFEPTMGQWCYFIHSDMIEDITCNHYIQIRKTDNSHLFNGAKKYVWMHDVVSAEDTPKAKALLDNNVKVIGVSRWHKNNIKEHLEGVDTTYIYNPVQDELYVDPEFDIKYDNHRLVWTASPHKGLGHALELFKEIRKQNDKMQLIIFNPGYLQLDNVTISSQAGVTVYGPMNALSVWAVIQKSLCVFYPTQWKETFGLVAAEANAVGTPLVTNSIAALKEVVSNDTQFAENDQDVIDKVLNWNKNGRPKTTGREEFKFSNVIMDWVKLLAK